jgi:DNA-binding transcriptional ArsR family regulator
MGTVIDERTRRQIERLLEELRKWHPGEPEATVEELCERFELPELVVRRLCDSEGFSVEPAAPERVVDETTQPIDVD